MKYHLAHYCENARRVIQGDSIEHLDRWETVVDSINDLLPSGSGFDAGSTFNVDESKKNRLVFNTSYHHMNEYGSYDGWTEHKVIIMPCFLFGFDMKITGRNRNDIKEYIEQAFESVLSRKYSLDIDGNRKESTNA